MEPVAMRDKRSWFSLTLMVSHACNLRCRYCYTGRKFDRPMPSAIGAAAIECALQSLAAGGLLELAFFGGEPLLESARILEWMDYGRSAGAWTGSAFSPPAERPQNSALAGAVAGGRWGGVHRLPSLF
jgi:sulfatase maturation enzyme AslB (radical SAM superfamily)